MEGKLSKVRFQLDIVHYNLIWIWHFLWDKWSVVMFCFKNMADKVKIGFGFWIVNLSISFWQESKNVCSYAQLSNIKMYFRMECERIKCREYRRMCWLANALCKLGFFLSVSLRKLHHLSLIYSFDWEIRMFLFFGFWTLSKMFSDFSMNSLKSNSISTVRQWRWLLCSSRSGFTMSEV